MIRRGPYWRERVAWMIAGIGALAVIAVYSGVIEGGPLDPPAAPSSTDGVRLPGTPISSLPFIATLPNQYYLTRDLTLPDGGAGISVANDDVHIDLNGFTLHGNGGTGISVPGTRSRVSVRNGNIAGFTTGVFQSANAASTQITIEDVRFGEGTTPISVQESATISGVTITGALGAGIVAGPNARVDAVIIEGAVGFGIDVGADSSVQGCTISGVTGGAAGQAGLRVGAGSMVEDCVVRGNQTSGIVGGAGTRVSDVMANSNVGGDAIGISLGQGSSVLNSVARLNGSSGIVVGNYSIVERSVARSNGAHGMAIGARSTVRASVADANGLMGIAATNAAGAVIQSNVVTRNDGHGIEAGTGVHILSNTVRGNGAFSAGTGDGAGISLISTISIVEDNVLTNNDIGLLSTSGNNSIVRNTAQGNPGGDYQFFADDLQGTTITLANVGTDTHSHYNYDP